MEVEPRTLEAAQRFVGRAFRKFWPDGVLGAPAGLHSGTVVTVCSHIRREESGEDLRGIFFELR